MQIQFDAAMPHQVRAMDSVVGLLRGHPLGRRGGELALGDAIACVPNRFHLSNAALLDNLRSVQRSNGLPTDERLATIATRAFGSGDRVDFPNFTIEMETGTGKTYTYIRTALDLRAQYGFTKFVIVVPSLAIREGVLKTFRMTAQHLAALYDRLPYRAYSYDSDNLTQVRRFAESPNVQFMVMTIASFRRALGSGETSNVIYRPNDRLHGRTPIELIQETRPILILDEPQNMETGKSRRALASLKPLFALRYSATHRHHYNLIYRLSPFEAYRRGLVKKVQVAGVEDRDANLPYLRLEDFRSRKKSVAAVVRVQMLGTDGTPRQKQVVLRQGDDLADVTSNPAYSGYIVRTVDARDAHREVRFVNGTTLRLGSEVGPDRERIFRAQIRTTLEIHRDRQQELAPGGIKVLSLFFIDRVDSYAQPDGLIRRIFREEFDRIRSSLPDWDGLDADAVQAAYFAQKQNRHGTTELLDSKTGETRRDEEAFDLIMRDKESLLSFPEPDDDLAARRRKQVSFIFSHSALREGWDNPNVFQICTLNHAVSDMRKRQEIGRGVRLPVNQSGERVYDPETNLLTVVANESYERYVGRYQSEISEEFGADTGAAPPPPIDAREQVQVRLVNDRFDSADFDHLWGAIARRTRYRVRLDTDRLVSETLEEFRSITIRPPRVVVGVASMVVDEDDERFDHRITYTDSLEIEPGSRPDPVPNLLELVQELLWRDTPPLQLTRRTLARVFAELPAATRSAALANPQEFAASLVNVLRGRLADQWENTIEYLPIDDRYPAQRFRPVFSRPAVKSVPSRRSVYDAVAVDSDVERVFAEALERWDQVRLYLKLPGWFVVPTPVGMYNPDWAILLDDGLGGAGRVLVRETKGSTVLDDLRPDERRKILFGQRHFSALGVDYDWVTSVDEVMATHGRSR